MIEIIENWATNLKDYQSLVHNLFDILGIDDDSLKNRTFLLESIKELVNIHFDEEAEEDEKYNVLTEMQKNQASFKFFCEEAKRKLGLENYSNEAMFDKIFER